MTDLPYITSFPDAGQMQGGNIFGSRLARWIGERWLRRHLHVFYTQTYMTLKLQNIEGSVVRWEASIGLIGQLFRS
jgi:hypothetical protein